MIFALLSHFYIYGFSLFSVVSLSVEMTVDTFTEVGFQLYRVCWGGHSISAGKVAGESPHNDVLQVVERNQGVTHPTQRPRRQLLDQLGLKQDVMLFVIDFVMFCFIYEKSKNQLLWSSGKWKGIVSTQEVTQRSFIDFRLSIIDIDFRDALH